jgi:hypothetical protein
VSRLKGQATFKRDTRENIKLEVDYLNGKLKQKKEEFLKELVMALIILKTKQRRAIQ